MPLYPGDKVLVRLGNKKRPEEETYSVLSTRGTEVYAKNEESGRVIRRHLSRFTKIVEKSTQPPDPVIEKDHASEADEDIIALSALNEAQPPQPTREQPHRQRHQQTRVRFNPRARARDFNPDMPASRPTTRSKTAQTGVPVPNFPTTTATLERSKDAQETARQMFAQYRMEIEAAENVNREQPPQD